MKFIVNETIKFRHQGEEFLIRVRIWRDKVTHIDPVRGMYENVETVVLIDRDPAANRRHGEPMSATGKIANIVYSSPLMLGYYTGSFFYVEENRVRYPEAEGGFLYEYHSIKFRTRAARFLGEPSRTPVQVEFLEETIGAENVRAMSSS